MRQSCVGACPNPSQYVQPFLVSPMPLHLRFTVVHVLESSDGQAFCSKVRHARSLAEETEYDVLSSTQRFGFAVSTVSIMWASSRWSPRPTLRTTFLAELRPTYQQVAPFECRISSLFLLVMTRKGSRFPWLLPGLLDPFIRTGASRSCSRTC